MIQFFPQVSPRR